MELGPIIKNTVIVGAILMAVFLSQQAYFKTVGKDFWSEADKNNAQYQSNIRKWFASNIYPRVSGEVATKGEIVKEELNKQKNNFVQMIWEKFKNYFAEKFSKTFGTEVK